MEQLTKQQIVLVTLLVSFVTSIATGIVTVALMDQAPPGVTQTINRVVERTIEKVVPAPNQQTASVITKETIVVKEDDLVVEAVAKNTKSVVSIIAVTGEGESKTENFAGNGLIVGKDGLIATDTSIVTSTFDEAGNPIPRTFNAVLSDNTALPIVALSFDVASGIVLFRPTLTEKTKSIVFIPAKLADASSLKLGQTIIALGGEKVSVATGIVANLSDMPDTSTATTEATSTPNIPSTKSSHRLIQTDISSVGKTFGSIIANLSGDVVGMRTVSAGTSASVFLPASLISTAIAKNAVSTPSTIKAQ
ncbi:MAG: serine protease [bacterium]|nr:serine protease [bacterium]